MQKFARPAPSAYPILVRGKALREQLATLGVKVTSTGNRFPMDPAEIRKALALRTVEDDV